jgi:hypothetical protein
MKGKMQRAGKPVANQSVMPGACELRQQAELQLHT